MKIRTIFFLCLAALSIPAIGSSLWLAGSAWHEWALASQSTRYVRAMGDVMRSQEVLGIERASLMVATTAAEPQRDDLAQAAATTDAALAASAGSLAAAHLPLEAVTRTQREMERLRQSVAAAALHPPAERDPQLLPGLVQAMNPLLDALLQAGDIAEQNTDRSNIRVAQVGDIASQVAALRSLGGGRNQLINNWIAASKPVPQPGDDFPVMTGQIMATWDRIRQMVKAVGEPPHLRQAIEQTQARFFRDVEPRYEEYGKLARAGAERPMTMDAYRTWAVASLKLLVPARNAAVADAVDLGQDLEARR